MYGKNEESMVLPVRTCSSVEDERTVGTGVEQDSLPSRLTPRRVMRKEERKNKDRHNKSQKDRSYTKKPSSDNLCEEKRLEVDME